MGQTQGKKRTLKGIYSPSKIHLFTKISVEQQLQQQRTAQRKNSQESYTRWSNGQEKGFQEANCG
jgi:hypothetical protein